MQLTVGWESNRLTDRIFSMDVFRRVNHCTLSRLARASLLLLSIVAAGCQSTPMRQPRVPVAPQPQDPAASAEVSADELMQNAALASGPAAIALYLSAADAYMTAGDWGGVEAALASTEEANQRADLFAHFAFLQAALSLHRNDPVGAQTWLDSRLPAIADLGGRDPNLARATLLQAAVCGANEIWDCAANQLISLEEPEAFASAPWFQLANPAPAATAARTLNGAQVTPQQREPFSQPLSRAPGSPPATLSDSPDSPSSPHSLDQALNEQIWHYVSLTPASIAMDHQSLPSRKHQGWWSLRAASAQGRSLAEQQQSVRQWQRRYGDHPAGDPWPLALTAMLEDRPEITSVALLLPLSGPLSAAGNAVRNGFISAQLADNARLSARFYDSASQPLPQLFEQALAAGAQVLIGPLSKPNVDSLPSLNPQVPMLALNYFSTAQQANPNILQLGLAIEDEAATLARQLKSQGLTRVLIVHSEQDWSLRAAARLQSELGETATLEAFAGAQTVTEAVGRGMFVEESHLRSQRVYRQIGTHIEFVARARQDLDAVIALVNNTEAKVLVPALKFHFGNHLPIYATGQAMRGAKPEDLNNLTGFHITELPWFVNRDPLANEVAGAFRLTGNSLSALYALGSDAYQLADRLPLLRDHRDLSFNGASGALNVQADGRFTRELAWGVIAQQRLIPVPRVSGR